jgi:hypothetical protein
MIFFSSKIYANLCPIFRKIYDKFIIPSGGTRQYITILVAYLKSMKLESVFCCVKSTRPDNAFVVFFACKVSHFLHNEKHGKSIKLGFVKSMKPDTAKDLCFCCLFHRFYTTKRTKKVFSRKNIHN